MQPSLKNLLQKVEKTIISRHMFCVGDSVLIGVSGGPDSMALLHLLILLAPKWQLNLGIAHLNHSLRGSESDSDADFVADMASQLGIPFHMETADILGFRSSQRLSLEDAARRVRYDFFHRISCQFGYNKIAIGHHKEDNAELMLMFLFRGSGMKGFSGISPVREDNIVRPLINVNKNELLSFLNGNGIPYRLDRTNEDTTLSRNWIRHEMIPYLQNNYNPAIVESLNRYADIIRSENDWMDEIIQSLYPKSVIQMDEHQIILSVPALMTLHRAARRRIIRSAIERIHGNLLRITFSHIEAIDALADGKRQPAHLALPDGIRIQLSKNQLIFHQSEDTFRGIRNVREDNQPFSYIIRHPVGPTCIDIPEIGRSIIFSQISIDTCDMNQPSSDMALMDLDTLSFPLILRNAHPSDRFKPLGMNGTQKIKKFFIDHKIDSKSRQQSPLLLSRDKIVWIAGHRISNDVKISASTKMVLKIEIS
jgi:tRNA(Ile)-lysidine synthase